MERGKRMERERIQKRERDGERKEMEAEHQRQKGEEHQHVTNDCATTAADAKAAYHGARHH